MEATRRVGPGITIVQDRESATELFGCHEQTTRLHAHSHIAPDTRVRRQKRPLDSCRREGNALVEALCSARHVMVVCR
jgi:hypothetical protein